MINFQLAIGFHHVTIMFKGEKTLVFWIGLIILGYSVWQFFNAGWQIVYLIFFYPNMIGDPSMNISLIQALGSVPEVVGGVIFMIIGLYMMKVGTVKKEEPIIER